MLVPRAKWYRVALAISRFEALVEPYLGIRTSARGTEARLQSWIKDLTKIGPFPIPLRSDGIAHVAAGTAGGSGVMFCSTHVPLNDMLLRVLAENGYTCLTVSHPDSVTDGRYPVPASDKSVGAVIVGPKALLAVRGVLRRGDSVFHLLDENVDAPLHDNAFRLIGRVSAPLLFWSVDLAGDGTIYVKIEPYPEPSCATEESIQRNVAFAEAHRAAWRRSLRERSSSSEPRLKNRRAKPRSRSQDATPK